MVWTTPFFRGLLRKKFLRLINLPCCRRLPRNSKLDTSRTGHCRWIMGMYASIMILPIFPHMNWQSPLPCMIYSNRNTERALARKDCSWLKTLPPHHQVWLFCWQPSRNLVKMVTWITGRVSKRTALWSSMTGKRLITPISAHHPERGCNRWSSLTPPAPRLK